MEIRVYYEDTDAGGVVYYANYLRWFERARTEFLRERGLDLPALQAEDVIFTVTRCDTHYKRPARYGDLVRVETSVLEVGGATLDMVQRVLSTEGVLLVEANLRLACVAMSTVRPRRIPDSVRSALA